MAPNHPQSYLFDYFEEPNKGQRKEIIKWCMITFKLYNNNKRIIYNIINYTNLKKCIDNIYVGQVLLLAFFNSVI